MRISGGRMLIASLLLVSPFMTFAQQQTRSPLDGTSWRLVQFEGGDGKVVKPLNPDNFTLDFLLDGRLSPPLAAFASGSPGATSAD